MTPDIEKIREALALGVQYARGVESTIPIHPNVVTPDRVQMEEALRVAQHLEAAFPAVVEALTDLDRAALKMVQLVNSARKDGASVAEWDKAKHELHEARLKAGTALALLEKKP